MISKLIIRIANVLKPILLKVFPYELLKKCKGKMINRSFRKLNNIKAFPYDKSRYERGINIIGNIKAETGLGQSCRLVAGLIQKAGVPFTIYQYDQLGSLKIGDHSWDHKISEELPYNINLVHINPHEFGIAYMQMDPSVFEHRYNIAYWLWELEEFPDIWTPCFNCFHEIWTPSEFISKAIRKKTNLPVVTVPYYIDMDTKQTFGRVDFGLPDDKFLFLMMYDHSSVMERKNPIGVLQAFKMAFDKDNLDVGLVIKINNFDEKEVLFITKILDGYKNVYFIKDTLSREKVNNLIQSVDVFVSLHRAEGFGLVLAESMYLGTPTIATNWSSNTEFMNNEVACMVDFKFVQIEKDLPPFQAGNRWADPNLEEAARCMRKLYGDQEFYKQIHEKAEIHIKEKLGFEPIEKILYSRIQRVY